MIACSSFVARHDLRAGAHLRADRDDAGNFSRRSLGVRDRQRAGAAESRADAPRLTLPAKTRITFWPERGDAGLDLGFGAVADAHHAR